MEKKRASMSSLASRQKCDMAADLAAVVRSLIPDVIADMEIQAGDDQTEDEKSTPMIPVLPNQPEPKKKSKLNVEDYQVEVRAHRRASQSHSARQRASRSESCIQAASTTYSTGSHRYHD
jgi:hypothetical protein